MHQVKRGRPRGKTPPLTPAERQQRYKIRQINPRDERLLLSPAKGSVTKQSLRLENRLVVFINLLAVDVFASNFSRMANALVKSRIHQVDELIQAADKNPVSSYGVAFNESLRAAINLGLTIEDLEESSIQAAVIKHTVTIPEYPQMRFGIIKELAVKSLVAAEHKTESSELVNKTPVKRNFTLDTATSEKINELRSLLGNKRSEIIRSFLECRLLQVLEIIQSFLQFVDIKKPPEALQEVLFHMLKESVAGTGTARAYLVGATRITSNLLAISDADSADLPLQVQDALNKHIHEGADDV